MSSHATASIRFIDGPLVSIDQAMTKQSMGQAKLRRSSLFHEFVGLPASYTDSRCVVVGDFLPGNELTSTYQLGHSFTVIRFAHLVEPLRSHILPPANPNDAYQRVVTAKDSTLGVVFDWTALS